MHRSALLPFVAGALAIGIFIFDTVSPLQFAVAVLYVVVALIAATYYQRRAVLIAAGGEWRTSGQKGAIRHFPPW